MLFISSRWQCNKATCFSRYSFLCDCCP